MTIIEPQKCRGKLRSSMWDDPEYPAEFKYHGVRYLMYCNGSYNLMKSRHISVKGGYVDKSNQMPHLRDLDTRKFAGTILDGEVILNLFGTVRDVTSITGSSEDLAIQKQEQRGYLSYMVFDIPYYKNKDIRTLSLEARKIILSEVCAIAHSQSIHNTELRYHDKEIFYHEIVRRGGEGIILKYIHSQYGERRHWIKVKKEQTFDVIITGFVQPEAMSLKKGDDKETITRYAKKGWIGSIEIGLYTDDLVEVINVGSVSGMDESTRAMLSNNMGKYIGRVIEIKAQSQLASGKFEHPRFVRFRDDKSAEECVYGD